MRKIVLGVAFVTLLAGAAHAQRQAPPDAWCRDMALDRGSVQICEAYTYEQCMASRTGGERCYLNPRYSRRFN